MKKTIATAVTTAIVTAAISIACFAGCANKSGKQTASAFLDQENLFSESGGSQGGFTACVPRTDYHHICPC